MSEERGVREPIASVAGWRRAEASESAGVDWLRERLTLKQPSVGRPRWELWAEPQIIGTVERRGFLARDWEIAGPSGPWELARDWRGRRRIGRPGAAVSAARYQPRWRGGAVELEDATRLTWRRLSLWRREWTLANEEGYPFVTFKAHARGLRFEGSVAFDEAARRLADPEPLVLLGWILILDARRRAHAH